MIKKFFLGIGIAAFLLGCSKIKIENPTNEFLKAKRLVKSDNAKLSEVSGVASSIINENLFWVHNDSGNDAEVYLVDKTLKILLTCRLENIENRDWEDIAVGPGPEEGKSYLYVGEIGDNNAKYKYKFIYRFEEPKWNKTDAKLTIAKFDTITFRLPDKKKDTETLLLDPNTKDIFIVSKREEPVWVYELKYPQSTKDTITAIKLVSLPYTQIVGGDISNDGKKILLKNYEHIYYWNNSKNEPLEELFKRKPFEIPYELEPQGEAISWARDDSGFYTLSEQNMGKDTFFYFYQSR